ncbi:MAG: apolipoprotein N-acyltransferase [Candidatus Omnitrophica bacterium]|nr:apolipoprotein N-acyltransferase [Candidatus Omnitrophota bacterium]
MAGFIFYATSLYWISTVAKAYYLFIAFYLAFFWAIFFWLIFSFPPNLRIIYGMSLWYFLELIIQYLFTGFPWLPLSLSQWSFPTTARIASIIGTAGLSALVMGTNISIHIAIKEKKFFPLLICLLSITTLAYIPLLFSQKTNTHAFIRIAAIQGNAGYFGQIPEESFEKYFRLTNTIRGKPDLVIWPESSYPSILTDQHTAFKNLLEKSFDFPILMGTLSKKDESIYNSAFLFKDGSFTKYDKIHLVPFGEYVPLSRLGLIRSLYKKFAGEIPELTPGDSTTTFKLNSINFSVLICFENIFPFLVQTNLKYNPNFFVTITNDSWYNRSAGPYQHFAHNIFRAIETGRPVVQVSTTGITGFSTPDGYFELFEKNGQNIMVEGVMEIYLSKKDVKNPFYASVKEIGISVLFLILTGTFLCRK